MGQPLPCDNHPDQLAAILMTNLETGDTLTLCGPCLTDWCAIVAGVRDVAEAAVDETPEPTEEAADLEPEPPAPDAGPKSEPEPATPPATEAQHQAKAAQEATAPGD